MAERRDTKNRLLNKGEYQKSDGRYMYRYTDFDGNVRFIYSWTLTQSDRTPKGKQSGKCLRELEKEIAKDAQDKIDSFGARKLTLDAMYEDYIASKKNLKISTKHNYTYLYKRFVKESLGNRKIASIKYSDIKKFYNHLICDLNFRINSVGTIHTILHPIFSTAVKDGYIRINPADGVMAELKKEHNWVEPKKHALTEQEQLAFMDYVRSSVTYNHWLPVFTVLLGTGCRVSELCGLTWEDCDFENDIITINHNLVYKPDEVTGISTTYISTPKTKSGNREIPMFDVVRQTLLNERKRQMRDGFCKTVIDGYSGFIFTNKSNEILLPHNINAAIHRIVKDYNFRENVLSERANRKPLLLPHFTAHILRHTFCTRMCEYETNIKVIQEIMGHSDITVTMDVYNEATREKKQQSFESLEGKFMIC